MYYYQLTYLFTVTFLCILGIFLMWQERTRKKHPIRMKRTRFDVLKEKIRAKMYDATIDKLFQHSGLSSINTFKYQVLRYSVLFVSLALFHSAFFLKGGDYPLAQILVFVTLFFLSSPTETLLGKKTPFKHVINWLTEGHKRKQDVELGRIVSQLKNTIIIKHQNPSSSDFILQQLYKFSKITKPIFSRMLAMWSLNEKIRACGYFSLSIGTQLSRDLANVFSKLDKLNPIELREQLEILQKEIKEDRKTRKLEEKERRSYVIYFVIALACALIVLNFIVLVYFIEVFSELQNTF